MKKKPTHYKKEGIQGLAQQEKRTQVQRRYYKDPTDSHKKEYGRNFQNKSCCDSRC
jgi:hypothetical protein